MTEYDSNGNEIKIEQKTIIGIPEHIALELEKIKQKADRLRRNKNNCLYQTKQIFVLEMFLGWDKDNLKKFKEKVEHYTKQVEQGDQNLILAAKSLEFSQDYVAKNGDDEDKASVADSILKKIKKLKKQQAELQAQYDEQFAKENKKD